MSSESRTPCLQWKDRLELIEKKVDIQKKQIEVKKEKWMMDEMMKNKTSPQEEVKFLIEKATLLKELLAEVTIDNERTVLGSEPFLTPVLIGKDRQLVKHKLLELIAAF